jgi:hypothetical protein
MKSYTPIMLSQFQWTEIEAYQYWLTFELVCQTNQGKINAWRATSPNRNVQSITSPFTFNPVNFFTKPDPETVMSCELHSSLYSSEEQAAPTDTGFRFVSVRSTRQHHTEKIITLGE